MARLVKGPDRIYRFFVGAAIVSLVAACAFVSKGTVIVNENCPGCAQTLTDDAVALAIAPLLERRGFRPVWSPQSGSGPCTGARGCSWAPEGKGWLQPWIMVGSPSSGQVRVMIETRHDDPRQDIRVRDLTEELAKAVREHFGSANVAIEKTY